MNLTKSDNELFNPKTNNLISIFLLVILFIISAIIILTFGRGFDFSDEGYYLLSYKHSDIYRGGILNFHIIISGLTDWLNPGIKAYRWMSIIITIFSSFVLSFGLYKWIKANYSFAGLYNKFLFIFCFISIGNFLFFFSGLQTINYNTLINFLLQVSTGLVLYLFSFDSAKLLKYKSNISLLTLLGFICSYSFFTKFSTGVLQFFVYIFLFIVFLRKQPFKYILFSTALIIFGSLIGFLSYFTVFQGYSEWLTNFRIEYSILSDHSPIFIINKYFDNFLYMKEFFQYYFSWLILFPVLIFIKNSAHPFLNQKRKKYLINAVSGLLLILFIYQIIHFNFYRSTFANDYFINAFFYIVIITIQILLLFTILLYNRKIKWSFISKNFNKIIILLFLLLSAFIGVFGTTNPIFLNLLFHIAPWFGAMIILLIELSKHIKSTIVHILFITIITVITSTQIIDGSLFCPYYSGYGYRSERNAFFQQTEYVPELPLLDGIKVDKKTKTFMLEMKMLLDKHNFKKGYPIFGFFIQGIIYLVDGVTPGPPISYFDENNFCNAIAYYNLNNNLPIIIESEKRPMPEIVLNNLRNENIMFPEEYHLVGEVNNPDGVLFKVYFPKMLL